MNIFVDLAGTLMDETPFDLAHKEWFSFMGKLLQDESVEKLADKEDYFPEIYNIMSKYLGNIDKKDITSFSRNLYAMMCIVQTKPKHLNKQFVSILKKLKKEHRIILISTIPSAAVDPILTKLKINNLFDDTFKSPLDKQPEKKTLFTQAIDKYGLGVYVGDGNKQVELANKLKLKTILVTWFSGTIVKADVTISSPDQLVEALKTLT